MLTWDFEADLAASRVYLMGKIADGLDEDSDYREYYRKANNLRQSMNRRRRQLNDLWVKHNLPETTEAEKQELKKQLNRLMEEILGRACRITMNYYRFVGGLDAAEAAERARFQLPKRSG